MSRARLAGAIIAVAAGIASASACDSPRATTCPGEPVATFQLKGESVAGADARTCPFASDASVGFTATLAFEGDSGALLCLDRTDAEPMRGTRDGGHVEVASATATARVDSCACGVQVTETVSGDVLQADGGSASAFTGELDDHVAPADGGTGGASCEPDGGSADAGARCGVPCDLRWRLTTGS